MSLHRVVFAFYCLLLTSCASVQTVNQSLITEFDRMGLQTREDERGVVVLVPDVFFDFDSDVLNESARDKIQLVTAVLNNAKSLSRKILVEGHADAIGPDRYNMTLSQRRAETVKNELLFSNVRPDRIVMQWAGESRPVAPNVNPDGTDNREGRQLNRRVEVVVLNP